MRQDSSLVHGLRRAIVGVLVLALTTSGCRDDGTANGDVDVDDDDDDETGFRAGALTPQQVAAEVAALRAVPMALDPSSAAGVLSGSSQVGSRGQALWSMSLDVAPGVAGLAPDLSINYDSTGGNGALGLGFSLGGLSSIRRCSRTIADDEQWSPVRWTNDDAICLGGDRLVLEAGAYGLNGARYRPAHDPAVRVVQHGPLSDRGGSFEVFQSTGHVLTYGTAAATLWRGANPTQAQPYVWGLVQRRDRFANTVDYEYEYPTMLATGPGDLRLGRIRYGGTGPLATRRQVSFTYEGRADAVDSWWFGAHQRVESRLQRIEINGPNSLLLRRYWLGYDNGGDAERSHLKSLAVCDGAGVCLPPIAFAWAEPPGESWGQVDNFEYFPVFGRALFGLGGEDLTELFFSNRGALVTDLDGDLKHEILLRPDSPYTSEMFLWRPDANNDDTNEEFYMPAAPAMPSYLDTEIRIALAAGTPPGADLFARVQPPWPRTSGTRRIRATKATIALPKAEHIRIPTVRGDVGFSSARQALAQDIRNLRTYTTAPNGALQNLIQLNKTMYPGAFAR